MQAHLAVAEKVALRNMIHPLENLFQRGVLARGHTTVRKRRVKKLRRLEMVEAHLEVAKKIVLRTMVHIPENLLQQTALVHVVLSQLLHRISGTLNPQAPLSNHVLCCILSVHCPDFHICLPPAPAEPAYLSESVCVRVSLSLLPPPLSFSPLSLSLSLSLSLFLSLSPSFSHPPLSLSLPSPSTSPTQ
jgi:hypothetical protein